MLFVSYCQPLATRRMPTHIYAHSVFPEALAKKMKNQKSLNRADTEAKINFFKKERIAGINLKFVTTYQLC